MFFSTHTNTTHTYSEIQNAMLCQERIMFYGMLLHIAKGWLTTSDPSADGNPVHPLSLSWSFWAVVKTGNTRHQSIASMCVARRAKVGLEENGILSPGSEILGVRMWDVKKQWTTCENQIQSLPKTTRRLPRADSSANRGRDKSRENGIWLHRRKTMNCPHNLKSIKNRPERYRKSRFWVVRIGDKNIYLGKTERRYDDDDDDDHGRGMNGEVVRWMLWRRISDLVGATTERAYSPSTTYRRQLTSDETGAKMILGSPQTFSTTF